jgi:hypothetical protein
MFLAAVTRPSFDAADGTCIFDGKIGIWPFIEKAAAQRSSKLRKRGTIQTKPVSVKNNYLQMIIEKMLPVI